MTDREPRETRNLDIYGHEALQWSRIRTALDEAPRIRTLPGSWGSATLTAVPMRRAWVPSGPTARCTS